MTKILIYQPEIHKTRNVFKLTSQDYKFLCPSCFSELLVLPDYDVSLKYQRHPGIYCPKNENHVAVRLFESSLSFWDEYNKLREQEKQS